MRRQRKNWTGIEKMFPKFLYNMCPTFLELYSLIRLHAIINQNGSNWSFESEESKTTPTFFIGCLVFFTVTHLVMGVFRRFHKNCIFQFLRIDFCLTNFVQFALKSTPLTEIHPNQLPWIPKYLNCWQKQTWG